LEIGDQTEKVENIDGCYVDSGELSHSLGRKLTVVTLKICGSD